MLRKKCDRCERVIEAADDMAGKKMTCPGCGDVNVMPLSGGDPDDPPAEAKLDRAAAAGYPPDSGPEQRVMVVRRAMLRARPLTGMLLILGLAGGVTGALALGIVTPPAWGLWALAAVCLIVLIVWKVRTFDSALVITNKRTTEREGILSKNISEVLHDNIRNVQIHQTFIQRLWGVGEIAISSAGQDGFEIRAKDIPRPDEVRKVIDLYRPL